MYDFLFFSTQVNIFEKQFSSVGLHNEGEISQHCQAPTSNIEVLRVFFLFEPKGVNYMKKGLEYLCVLIIPMISLLKLLI